MTDKIVFAKYIGNGSFVAGVPARDMIETEWFELPEEMRRQALEAGTHKLLKSGTKSVAAEA